MVNVFLSSTGRDLTEYRELAYRAIERLDGYHCVRMEDFGARAGESADVCRERVASCPLFVGIVGHLYGGSPPDTDESFTELEYLSAFAAGKPRLMFVAPDGFLFPANLRESDERSVRQQAFRSRVNAEAIRATFNSPAELAWEITSAIRNWERSPSAVSPETHVPFSPPQPPLNTFLYSLLLREMSQTREQQEQTLQSLLWGNWHPAYGSTLVDPLQPLLPSSPTVVNAISLNSVGACSGDYVALTLTADTVAPGIGAYDIEVTYDPMQAMAVDCCSPPHAVHGLHPDRVKLSGAILEGLVGRVYLATITFRVDASPAIDVAVRLHVPTLADPDGNLLSPQRLDDGIIRVGAV